MRKGYGWGERGGERERERGEMEGVKGRGDRLSSRSGAGNPSSRGRRSHLVLCPLCGELQ